MTTVTRSVAAALCGIAMICAPSVVSAGPNADADALKILKNMTEYIGGLESFSVHTVNTFEEVLDSGQKIQVDFSSSVVVQRPDKLRAERADAYESQVVVYDGNRISVYEGTHDIYASVTAPDNLDDMLHFARDSLDLVPPAGDLVFSEAYELLTTGLTSGVVVGKAVIGGIPCTQLAFTNPLVDFQIWVANGDKPLPVKYVLTTMDDPAHPQYIALMSDWNTDPMIADELFTIKIPQTATMTEFVFIDADVAAGE